MSDYKFPQRIYVQHDAIDDFLRAFEDPENLTEISETVHGAVYQLVGPVTPEKITELVYGMSAVHAKPWLTL